MYNKDEIKQIRVIPTSKDEDGFESDEGMELYLKYTLPEKLEGQFFFKVSLSGDWPILALIQYNNKIVASGIITSIEDTEFKDYKYSLNFDVSTIKYFEEPITKEEFLRKKIKLNNGEYFKGFSHVKLRFHMDCFDGINELISSHYYDKYDFLDESFINEYDYDAMKDLLVKYKNLILQGPPGVGKTFLAKRLVDSIKGYKCTDRIEMVQFHQSYSYEDFILGCKFSEGNGGHFYNFCKKAEKYPKKDYFFIIDDMNRGDFSKIFGELFTLLESDKRGEDYKIKLLHSDEYFSVPKNVYVIGLMNTVDRSGNMVDYGLRRRFAFFDLKPSFDSLSFLKYQDKIGNDSFDKLIEQIESLNDSIVKDDALGEGFCIGHSYFCNLEGSDNIEKDLRLIIDYKILPLLKEYWFNESEKVQYWKAELYHCLGLKI